MKVATFKLIVPIFLAACALVGLITFILDSYTLAAICAGLALFIGSLFIVNDIIDRGAERAIEDFINARNNELEDFSNTGDENNA